MKKILTERRLCELAGLAEQRGGDTEELGQTRRIKAKQQRHAAEKEFFGTDDGDPLVTTDVPQLPKTDPEATHKLTPDQLAQIEKDVPDEARRPVAMELYKSIIEPKWNNNEIEINVAQYPDVREALGQLIGWFHPVFHDDLGKPTYDNPSRFGVRVAKEFEKEGLDILENAEEFNKRVEKYMIADAEKEFKKNVATRKDATAKAGRTATPGTKEYDWLQDYFKRLDKATEINSTTTKRIKN